MYSIFHALDPDERLPRELILEGKRYRHLEKGTLLSIVGVLYLPTLMLSVVLMGSFPVGLVVAFGIAGAALLGVCLYVFSTRRNRV